jgi:hypothetical protein
VPPVVGALLVETETRAQYEQMRDEILRRWASKTKAIGTLSR